MQGYPRPPLPPKPGLSAGVVVLLVVGGFVVLGVLGLVATIVVYASIHAPPAGTADAGALVHVQAPVTSEPADTPPTPSAAAPPAPKRPRTVDFRCPAGSAPGGAVRAGCLCGDLILGSACGASGFRDVSATPTGCRFVCD